MALNFDSSLDEIEKIIPSPKINKNTADLFSEEEENQSNIDLNNNNLDIFEDISQIDNEEEENSINLKNNNNKNSKLLSTNDNTENSKKVKHHQLSEEIVKNSNNFDFLNIKSNRINNNEKKYNIFFDKNKLLNINSLREEYNKIKKDTKGNNIGDKRNYNKKYINIFDSNKQTSNSNLFLNLENNNKRHNKNIILYTNNDFSDIKLNSNFKTNHNSKQKEINDKGILKRNLFKEKNRIIFENKYKNIKNLNNIININKKSKIKKFYIYEEYKSNSSNNNFKINNTKSTIIENNSRINRNYLLKKYNKFSNDLKIDEENNSKINPLISFNKITENAKIKKLDEDFDTIYKKVENKIKQNKINIQINQDNQRYFNNNKFNKIMYELLSTSTNDNSIRNIKRTNYLNNNLNFIYRNNLKTQINQRIINPRLNNYIISDFSMNQKN